MVTSSDDWSRAGLFFTNDKDDQKTKSQSSIPVSACSCMRNQDVPNPPTPVVQSPRRDIVIENAIPQTTRAHFQLTPQGARFLWYHCHSRLRNLFPGEGTLIRCFALFSRVAHPLTRIQSTFQWSLPSDPRRSSMPYSAIVNPTLIHRQVLPPTSPPRSDHPSSPSLVEKCCSNRLV